MKQRAGEKIKLTSFNDLMGISEGESSVELKISRIIPFKNHPFKVKDDEKMEELIESSSTETWFRNHSSNCKGNDR